MPFSRAPAESTVLPFRWSFIRCSAHCLRKRSSSSRRSSCSSRIQRFFNNRSHLIPSPLNCGLNLMCAFYVAYAPETLETVRIPPLSLVSSNDILQIRFLQKYYPVIIRYLIITSSRTVM